MSPRTRIGEDIAATLQRDPAARSGLEVFLTSPGVHALFWYRLAHRLWRRGLKLPARMLSQWARSFTGIEIHPGATLGRRLVIDHGMGVVVGETAIVGEDCLVFHGVTLGGKQPFSRDQAVGRRHPVVGDRVVIGAGAIVLGAVTVGSDSAIGAQSVVLTDVPPGSLAVGVPAVIRPRKDSN